MKTVDVTQITRENICELRDRLGFTQTQFWNPVGVAQTVGSRYETGGRKRDIPTSVKVALLKVYEDEFNFYLSIKPTIQKITSSPDVNTNNYNVVEIKLSDNLSLVEFFADKYLTVEINQNNIVSKIRLGIINKGINVLISTPTEKEIIEIDMNGKIHI